VPYFPLAGALVGSLLAGLHLLLGRVLPGQAEAALLLLAAWLVTGGIHLDGLADTADGLACAGPPAQALEVMRDPRVGAAGAAALALDLILKWSCLATMEPPYLPCALVLMPVAGRQAIVLAMWRYPAARGRLGLAASFAGQVTTRHLLAALAITGVLFLLASSPAPRPAPFWLAAGAGMGAGLLVAALVARRLGGVTGDTYGAACEVAEAAFLMSMLLLGRG
jgi:cobalamin 5'-phosphate synthase/cobalamin synthase